MSDSTLTNTERNWLCIASVAAAALVGSGVQQWLADCQRTAEPPAQPAFIRSRVIATPTPAPRVQLSPAFRLEPSTLRSPGEVTGRRFNSDTI